MRPGLIDTLLRSLRKLTQPARSKTSRPKPRRTPPLDVGGSDVRVEYSPSLDGDADPGEVVWTWVSYEDDPSQGKDRPVVVIGHSGSMLAAVALTSRRRDGEEQVGVGTGPWDREGRPSYAKIERLLRIDPRQVRREGAILPENRFDEVVAGARRLHGDAFGRPGG